MLTDCDFINTACGPKVAHELWVLAFITFVVHGLWVFNVHLIHAGSAFQLPNREKPGQHSCFNFTCSASCRSWFMTKNDETRLTAWLIHRIINIWSHSRGEDRFYPPEFSSDRPPASEKQPSSGNTFLLWFGSGLLSVEQTEWDPARRYKHTDLKLFPNLSALSSIK